MSVPRVYRLTTRVAIDQFDPNFERNLIAHAVSLGYSAFLNRRHYSDNPFTEADWQRHDGWDEGWHLADIDYPGRFDPDTETFKTPN